jgi:hypothetical protein
MVKIVAEVVRPPVHDGAQFLVPFLGFLRVVTFLERFGDFFDGHSEDKDVVLIDLPL